MNHQAKKIFLTFFLAAAVLFAGGFFSLTQAQSQETQYLPLAPLPEAAPDSGTNLTTYLQGGFRLVIIIVAILAVIMIAYSGLQYMTSNAVPAKTMAKERLYNAVGGLLLLLGAVLILQTINPELTSLKLIDTLTNHPIRLQPTNYGQLYQQKLQYYIQLQEDRIRDASDRFNNARDLQEKTAAAEDLTRANYNKAIGMLRQPPGQIIDYQEINNLITGSNSTYDAIYNAANQIELRGGGGESGLDQTALAQINAAAALINFANLRYANLQNNIFESKLQTGITAQEANNIRRSIVTERDKRISQLESLKQKVSGVEGNVEIIDALINKVKSDTSSALARFDGSHKAAPIGSIIYR
jgi:hypothetical protein